MPALKSTQIEAAADAESLARLLINASRPLPSRLRERILTFGSEIVPPLIALLEDEALSMEDAPGEGWAPIHAVELLAELGAAEAAQPMLRLLAATEWDTILHDTLLRMLPKLGPAVLEDALAAHAATEDPERRSDYRSVLSKLGACDERVYEILVEAFDVRAMHEVARFLPQVLRGVERQR